MTKRKRNEHGDTVYPPKKKSKPTNENLYLKDYYEAIPGLRPIKNGIIPPFLYPVIKKSLKEKSKMIYKYTGNEKFENLLKKTKQFEKENEEYKKFQKYNTQLDMHKKLAVITPIDTQTNKNLKWKDIFTIIFSYECYLDDLIMIYSRICKVAYQAIYHSSFFSIVPALYKTTYIDFKRLAIDSDWNGYWHWGGDLHFLYVYLSRYLPPSDIFQSKKRQFHQEMHQLLAEKHHSWQVLKLYLQFLMPSFSHYFGSYFEIDIQYPFHAEMMTDKVLKIFKNCHWKFFKSVHLYMDKNYEKPSTGDLDQKIGPVFEDANWINKIK